MGLLVGGMTLEGQRVVRVLGALLVEDVFLSVVPVGETGHVRTHLHNGLWLFLQTAFWCIFGETLSTRVNLIMRRGEIHSMRVDNLRFFLQVERLLMVLHCCLCVLVWEALAVVGEQLRVGIANESISASSHASTFIPSRQLLNYKNDNNNISIETLNKTFHHLHGLAVIPVASGSPPSTP
jgi:hypothetical protein